MVFTYYTKLFRTGADRRNGILMPLLLSVTETVNVLRLKSLKKKKDIERYKEHGN